MDSGNWLTAVGNLLLVGGVFEGATLIPLSRLVHDVSNCFSIGSAYLYDYKCYSVYGSVVILM